MQTRLRIVLAGTCLALLAAACTGAPSPDPDPQRETSASALTAPARAARAISELDRRTIEEHSPAAKRRLARLAARAAAPSSDRLPDGNYRLALDDGQTVTTQGEGITVAEWASSLRKYPTLANQLALYGALYERAGADLRRTLARPDARELAAKPAADVKQLNLGLARTLLAAPAPTVGATTLAGDTCHYEIGVGGTPGDGTALCARLDDGLFAQTSLPLLDKSPCIKRQGHRGTCVAFAVTATIEDQARIATGARSNLSEQDLYATAKLDWAPDDYADCLDTGNTVEAMASAQYKLPYEEDWTYNPSLDRVDLQGQYLFSCTNAALQPTYSGKYCSDSAHQALNFCPQGPASCHYVKAVPGSSGIRVKDSWVIGTDEDDLLIAKALLMVGIPIIVSTDVTVHLKTPLGPDVKPDSPFSIKAELDDNQVLDGTHAMELVGWVPAHGSGSYSTAVHGYYIVRNSWGCGWADGGIAYLTEGFLTHHANTLTGLSVHAP